MSTEHDLPEHHLNQIGDQSRIGDRGFFERILKEFKETLIERDQGLKDFLEERNERLDERFVGQKDAINKAEQRMDVILAGFPQEYAKRLEIEQMKTTAETTAKTLAQQVVDSAAALSAAQDKVEDRTDSRMKKMEDYQARLTGMAIAAPIITAVVVFLLTRSIG